MRSKIRFLLIFSFVIFVSCNSEKENKGEEINKKSKKIFTTAIADLTWNGQHVNVDSITKVYTKIASDSAELGLEYAIKISDSVKIIVDHYKAIKDSLEKMEQDGITKKWNNSKAGKIQKKHPEWSNEDCERIASREIWIGMTLDMLKYERGNPNSANPSNYGSGREWQWCWDNYTPSCFYGNDDLIIKSYN